MFDWLALFILGFLVAAWNSSVGPTGGALIAGTSIIIPPPTSLLLQGLAALFSNGFRTFKLKKYLKTEILIPFFISSIIAIPIGYILLLNLKTDLWLIIIGIYVVVAGLLSFYQKRLALNLWPAGLLSTIASFLTGSGSLIAAPSIRKHVEDKFQLISNEALVVFFQGLIKTIILIILFKIPDNFLFLLSALLISMLIGNIIGLKILEKIPDYIQGKLQMFTVVLLGLVLIIQGLINQFG